MQQSNSFKRWEWDGMLRVYCYMYLNSVNASDDF